VDHRGPPLLAATLAAALRTRPAPVETGGMGEIAIALGLVAAFGALAAAFSVAPASLLVAGFWLVLGGMAFGVPTGFWYHVALRRSLVAAGALPERWWWSPTALHDAIPDADRAHVLAWCYAGAAGFLVTVAGCALVAFAAWRGI
jgi:hypothetical protein